jgi:hypothetical protein
MADRALANSSTPVLSDTEMRACLIIAVERKVVKIWSTPSGPTARRGLDGDRDAESALQQAVFL